MSHSKKNKKQKRDKIMNRLIIISILLIIVAGSMTKYKHNSKFIIKIMIFSKRIMKPTE